MAPSPSSRWSATTEHSCVRLMNTRISTFHVKHDMSPARIATHACKKCGNAVQETAPVEVQPTYAHASQCAGLAFAWRPSLRQDVSRETSTDCGQVDRHEPKSQNRHFPLSARKTGRTAGNQRSVMRDLSTWLWTTCDTSQKSTRSTGSGTIERQCKSCFT